MAISINRQTYVISIPKADLSLITGTLYELDTDDFRKELKGIESSEDGIVFPDTHNHSTEYSVAGVTYARAISLINKHSVTFEDGQYSVILTGSNNDIWDIENKKLNQNQVQVIPTNSAGLIRTDVAEKPTEAHLSVAYDDTTIEIGIWLVRLGETVLNPTSATVNWYKSDGTLVFTDNSSSPDARGQFEIRRVEALDADEAYYVDVIVADSQGVVTTRRGVTTVATI